MNAEFSWHPQAAFRGQRNYYHSTDLYEAVVSALAAKGLSARRFDLKMRERIVRRPRLDFVPGQPPEKDADVAASMTLLVDDQTWTVQVVQEAGAISARKAYDEGPIWDRIRQDGTVFTCEGADATPIEVVTALAVHAHKVLSPPQAPSRWLLAQFSATRMLDDREREYVRLEVARRMGTMTQSTLCGTDGPFGKLLFVLK